MLESNMDKRIIFFMCLKSHAKTQRRKEVILFNHSPVCQICLVMGVSYYFIGEISNYLKIKISNIGTLYSKYNKINNIKSTMNNLKYLIYKRVRHCYRVWHKYWKVA